MTSTSPDGPPDRQEALRALARELPNGAVPVPNVITSGQPSAAALERLNGAGCRTVVDLRGPDEPRGFDEPAVVARLDMTYVSIPVSYNGLGAPEFDRLREVLRSAGDASLLLHCASANRVGALLLPYLVLDAGQERETAFELACAVGLRHPGLAEAAFRYLDAHAG